MFGNFQKDHLVPQSLTFHDLIIVMWSPALFQWFFWIRCARVVPVLFGFNAGKWWNSFARSHRSQHKQLDHFGFGSNLSPIFACSRTTQHVLKSFDLFLNTHFKHLFQFWWFTELIATSRSLISASIFFSNGFWFHQLTNHFSLTPHGLTFKLILDLMAKTRRKNGMSNHF